ncbi:UPF0496 protein At3g19330 [Cornus florida]|uniref:UPF0496 protein At3g19330 n=1 Tax=Cornus florida TaxID=4283 RepID=UPI00289E7420|nr:UPF0496 protein At3g19330 [Cornus florida]XP_059668684.1 UPF0496 protein At3g19330 [Cornus florida]XP_059668685.1 UPF0496 protein At3g19330 [Cornus florida]
MMRCLRPSSLTATTNQHPSSSSPQGNSAEETPRSSTQPSPTINLTREYTLAVQTSSYSEIRDKIHQSNACYHDPDPGQEECNEGHQLLAQVLQPNRDCVQESLQSIRPNTLTRLVSAYFDHSEHTSHLCLLLYDSVRHARSLYAPLHNLLNVLPLDSDSYTLTQSQCDCAFDIFLQFDRLDNPFSCSDSFNFNDMRCCFSQLKQQLDHRLSKSRSRVRLLRHATTSSAICLIGTVVGVAISAAVIAAHALVTLVACPFFSSFLPCKITKKEMAHLAQLEAAAKGTYVLHNDLDTIDRLVVRLYTAVEGDKLLIRLGLERGRDRQPIQEVVKQLHKNHENFLRQLIDLEEHICLCFAAINRARSLLLQEIHLHQTRYS